MQLLPALPEETLYSRCVRTREVYGMTAEQFFSVFFNKTTHSVHPYLNTSLNILSEKTLESGHELWVRQTLIPLYAWALPEYRALLEDLTISAMNLYTICKLSSFAEEHPLTLKHCPVCSYHDIKNFGVAYWHRPHQISGITSCHHHKVRLNAIRGSRLSHIDRHVLPNEAKTISLSSEENFRFSAFTSAILERICSSPDEFITPRHTSIIKHFEKSVSLKDNTSVFEKLYNIAQTLDHTNKNLFPTQQNYVSYWKTLLYTRALQPPTRYLLLLYCLNELNPPLNR